MLQVANFNSFYGSSHILHDLTFEARSGEILTVLGRNGVGKTTLLRSIMGLTDSTTGLLEFDGRDLAGEPTHKRARAGIAYVPQGREIIPDFSVRENILMGRFAASDSEKGGGIPEIVGTLFPYLGENLDRPGGLLSGGQQQQLAIARALAQQPKMILLDEPTEGIQPNIVEMIEKTIQDLNSKYGLTILLVEQNVAFSRRASHRFVMLENGRAVAEGRADELTDDIVRRHMAI
ncbi:MAG: urea ABC transporter ATP-binding subunit UrtE [Pseudomonadota bacterium]